MHSGPEVSLEQVLACRERRAARQKGWLETNAMPLISFTVNMVGSIKRNKVSVIAFKQGYQAISDACCQHGISIVRMEKVCADTGYELLISAEVDSAEVLKKIMVAVEERHPLGRLFDIDVITKEGKILSRGGLGYGRRKCLICDSDAKVCSRSRTHSLNELKERMSEMIYECETVRSLLTE